MSALKRRVERLEERASPTDLGRSITIMVPDGYDGAAALAEVGVEPGSEDTVIFLRQFDDDPEPPNLIAVK